MISQRYIHTIIEISMEIKKAEGPEIKVAYRIRNNKFFAFFVDHIIESKSRKHMLSALLRIARDKFGSRVKLKAYQIS